MPFLQLPRLLLMIALVAVLVRAIVPMGYMPEMGSGKIFQMTICSLDGPKTVLVDEDMQPVHSSHSVKEKCEFSMMQHTPFNAEVTPFISIIAFAETKEAFVLKRHAFVRALFASNVQARGPPIAV